MRAGGDVILKDIISGTFIYIEQIGSLKILIRSVRQMVGVRGMAFARRSFSTNKKGTSPLNFQLNEPFLMFLRQRFL